jgi:tetratricopeptide (TPR) repeat protein
MSRTARYKAVYFTYFGAAGVLGLTALWYLGPSPLSFVAVAVALLIPGRILGFFWRDLLQGLRLLNAGDYAGSKAASERFLAYYAQNRWVRHLLWLGSSSYSRDPEVLALNNLGAAEFRLGEIDAAHTHLRQAIARDPLCPLPFYNLAIMAREAGDVAEMERCLGEAQRLGFTMGPSDQIVRASQRRFSATSGAGR